MGAERAAPLRPARDPAAVAAARAALADAPDAGAAETWEVLVARGLVPPAWLDDSTRGFTSGDRVVCPVCRDYDMPGCRRCRKRGSVPVVRAYPPSRAAAAALAADAAGLATAEALAREAMARLVRLGVAPAPGRVVWRVVGPRWYWSRVEPTWQTLSRHAPARDVHTTRPLFNRHDAALRAAAPTLHEWTRGAIANLRCFVDLWPAAAPPDPYGPLVALWETTGYGLDEFNDTDIVLVAPRLAGEPDPDSYQAPSAEET